MRFVAIDTVRDEGAAAILDEALRAEAIPVELKRVGMNPYLAQAVEIEVRVPFDRVDDAQQILGHLRMEAEDALTIAAGKAEALDEPEEAPAPESVEGPAGAVFMRLALLGMVLFGLFLCGAAYFVFSR